MPALAKAPASVPTGPQFDNRRVAAALIDLLFPLAACAAAYAAGLSLTRGLVLVGVAWTLYYFFALESGAGQTLGKRVMNLRVVSADGSPATMEQIAKRTVVRILDGHIVGLIVMLATGDRRVRLGDIVAGTVVTEAESTAVASDAATAPLEALAPQSPDPAPQPAAMPKPAKRSLLKRPIGMPSLSTRRRGGSASPKPASEKKPSFLKRPIAMPSFGKRSRNEVDLDEVGVSPVATGAAEPFATDRLTDGLPAAPPPEVEPFAPLTEPAAEAALYSDYDSSAPDEEPYTPAPALEFDAREPAMEFDVPEPWFEDAAREPLAEVDEAQPLAEPYSEPYSAPEEDLDIDPEMTIKPIETVSAIDAAMEDAEDRRPPGH